LEGKEDLLLSGLKIVLPDPNNKVIFCSQMALCKHCCMAFGYSLAVLYTELLRQNALLFFSKSFFVLLVLHLWRLSLLHLQLKS